jgi:hypothetical protein
MRATGKKKCPPLPSIREDPDLKPKRHDSVILKIVVL